MAVTSVTVRHFRSYSDAVATLGPGLTVIWGANGAGKTNLLEAIYFGCTGRSCRTANDRETVGFGAPAARVVIACADDAGRHELAVGFAPGEPKRMTADGAPVERLLDAPFRPLVSVFLPDRLELVKGVPALRRAHLDQLVAAIWPARAGDRRAFAQALAQRNALLARIRRAEAPRHALDAWDLQLATHALPLMAGRAAAIDAVAPAFVRACERLGLDGDPSIAYRPRSRAAAAEDFVAELQARRDGDLERAFTAFGPHRDDVLLARAGRELRTFGSQGQQRLALLALLLAEREALAELRTTTPPLLLLDDVMSELDATRRAALVEMLRAGEGQVVITTTDLDHIPAAGDPGVTRIGVRDGRLLQEALAA